ncbi:MAG: KGK domain-containing protein [Cyanobacteria bacterium P01_G01_bin.54]
MDNRFTPLEGDEVLSVDESVQILIGHRTFRASELTQALKQQLLAQGAQGIGGKEDWFAATGVSCEALRFGASRWLKGRVRISLEFCPDETAPDIKPFSAQAPSATVPSERSGSAFADEGLADDGFAADGLATDGLADELTSADLPRVEAAATPEPELSLDVSDEDSFFAGDEAVELNPTAGIEPDSPTDDSAFDDLLEADADPELAAVADDELSDPIAAMVDGLAEDDELETATEDIFADAPADPDDLFGDGAAESEVEDPFAETVGGDDELSGLLDDADDVFADAPTEMPAAEEETVEDLFADAPTDLSEDTTTVADEADIFATDADEDIFGESDVGELDLGGAETSDELAVEDAEDLFGDDDDDAIDWGLDDGEGDELSLDGGESSETEGEDDSVFADIWNDIDEMS